MISTWQGNGHRRDGPAFASLFPDTLAAPQHGSAPGTGPDGGATIWAFSRAGGWKRVPDPLPRSGEWEDCLERGGFSTSAVVLGGDSLRLEIYGAESPKRGYLFVLDVAGISEQAFVADLPSLLLLLRDLTPWLEMAKRAGDSESPPPADRR